MTVRAIPYLIAPPCPLADTAEHLSVFMRQRVTNGIRQIDDAGPSFNSYLNHLDQVIHLGPGCIHRREFHNVGKLACIGHHLPCSSNHLTTRTTQLVLNMDI
ncbi:hypothetical protein D3C76_1604660 [compost metagenome]